jgi:hypothetical protein
LNAKADEPIGKMLTKSRKREIFYDIDHFQPGIIQVLTTTAESSKVNVALILQIALFFTRFRFKYFFTD